MADLYINGAALRQILATRSIRQHELAERIGCTKFTVSRWCSLGTPSRINGKNANLIRNALTLTSSESAALFDHGPGGAQSLTDDEIDWLTVYRNLSPRDKHRVYCEVERIVERLNQSPASKVKLRQ